MRSTGLRGCDRGLRCPTKASKAPGLLRPQRSVEVGNQVSGFDHGRNASFGGGRCAGHRASGASFLQRIETESGLDFPLRFFGADAIAGVAYGDCQGGFVTSWLAKGAFNYGDDGERVQAGVVDAAQAAAPRADFAGADFIDGLEGSAKCVVLRCQQLLFGERAYHQMDGPKTKEMQIDGCPTFEHCLDLRRVERNAGAGKLPMPFRFLRFLASPISIRLVLDHLVDGGEAAQGAICTAGVDVELT